MENKVIKQKFEAHAAGSSLWLIRHGQTDWNLKGRWQGQSPDAPPLNETGRAQALAVRELLKNEHFSAIYSSDLLRSHQTAQLLAEPLGLSVTLEPRLREMDLGDWEGMLSDEIKEQFPHELAERVRDPINTRAPRGESPMQVARRVISAVDEITLRHCGEPVLIVAHGISLAVIICLARGIPLDQIFEYIPDNAKLCHVEWRTPLSVGELIQEKYFVV
jgi:broad specificity phosphatase PhoE